MTDDIFIVGASYEVCQSRLQTAINIMLRLGWKLDTGKTEGPATTITFLGVEISSASRTLSLPLARLQAYHKKVEETLSSKTVTSHQLDSLAGKLQWLS